MYVSIVFLGGCTLFLFNHNQFNTFIEQIVLHTCLSRQKKTQQQQKDILTGYTEQLKFGLN